VIAAAGASSISLWEHRHRQLRLHRLQVIGPVLLVDRQELGERGMHRAGPGVDLGVVAAGRFVDLRRVAGELVPEAVEVDALTFANIRCR
jgi:hypothetical protein